MNKIQSGSNFSDFTLSIGSFSIYLKYLRLLKYLETIEFVLIIHFQAFNVRMHQQ